MNRRVTTTAVADRRAFRTGARARATHTPQRARLDAKALRKRDRQRSRRRRRQRLHRRCGGGGRHRLLRQCGGCRRSCGRRSFLLFRRKGVTATIQELIITVKRQLDLVAVWEENVEPSRPRRENAPRSGGARADRWAADLVDLAALARDGPQTSHSGLAPSPGTRCRQSSCI